MLGLSEGAPVSCTGDHWGPAVSGGRRLGLSQLFTLLGSCSPGTVDSSRLSGSPLCLCRCRRELSRLTLAAVSPAGWLG